MPRKRNTTAATTADTTAATAADTTADDTTAAIVFPAIAAVVAVAVADGIAAAVAAVRDAIGAAVIGATGRIVRPTSRGDWYATVPVSAFGADATAATVVALCDGCNGRYVTRADDANVVVAFGGRGGAMIDAYASRGRMESAGVAAVVASVYGMVASDRRGGYVNDGRKNAIPSPVVAVAIGVARDIRDGAAVRATLGNVAASRRSRAVPKIAAMAATRFGTVDPFTPAADTTAATDAAADATTAADGATT